MAFVQFSRVSLAFGDRDILKDVNLNLSSGSRACLAGVNGAGKSTLMKVIAGKIEADSGDRAVQKGTRVSYLPQSVIAANPPTHGSRTVREEAAAAWAGTEALLDRMEELGRELEKTGGGGAVSGGGTDNVSSSIEDRRTAALVEEHHRLQEEVENSGYYRREAAISATLSGLGFAPGDMDRQVEEFSGGWQMRIALAKVLLENPDILLLDEPTNYLDIEARSWLESWLGSYTGGFLLVSHDRFFLDVTVNEVYEIFQGTLKRYVGNYSAYEKIRQQELESLVKRYEAQQEEIAKTEALIRRFRYKASKAAFAQELIKRLEKIEPIEIPESLKKISITFPLPPHAGRVALTLEGVGNSYGSNRVLDGVDLLLESEEKLVVAGRNGAGKSTLLRIIAGVDRDCDGSVKYGTGIAAGYFSQDAAETLTGSRRVLDFMEAGAPTHLVPKVRDMLGAFLFRGDDVFKPLSVLSGGEKSRLALLKMLLEPMILLILDEPTNHLDIHSKDILLDCLKNFTGAIVFVSHDRAVMEALSTKTLELGGGRHRLFYGGYGYYLDRINNEEGQACEASQRLPPASGFDAPASGVPSRSAPRVSAELREQEKQRQALIRRLRRQEEEILKSLETLEAEKIRLETELSKPGVYSNGEKARAIKIELDKTTAAAAAKLIEWEEKAAELEETRTSHQGGGLRAKNSG
jgi:ATP-binding cassette subfamily F protein 3